MGMEKAIAAGKEHRKPYRRSGRFDRTCRPGGSCPWCRGNRLVGSRKRAEAALELVLEAGSPASHTTHAVDHVPAGVAVSGASQPRAISVARFSRNR